MSEEPLHVLDLSLAPDEAGALQREVVPRLHDHDESGDSQRAMPNAIWSNTGSPLALRRWVVSADLRPIFESWLKCTIGSY